MPVSREISAEMTPVAAAPQVWVWRAAVVLAGSLLVAVCGRLALPLVFTPVPLSLAPFAVLVIGLFAGPRLAAATLGAYLAEGAMGLPVFAPAATVGLAHLLGPTGGYLLAYPAAAALISVLYRRTSRGFAAAALSAGLGSLVIIGSGAWWLGILTHASAATVVQMAVVPFLPGDVLKVVAAAGLAAGFKRLRRAA